MYINIHTNTQVLKGEILRLHSTPFDLQNHVSSDDGRQPVAEGGTKGWLRLVGSLKL